MSSATVIATGGLGTLQSAWQIVGQRDFNGDTVIWLISNLGVLNTGYLGNLGVWSSPVPETSTATATSRTLRNVRFHQR